MDQRQFSPVTALCLVLAGWYGAWLAGFGAPRIEENAAASIVGRLAPPLAADAEVANVPRPAPKVDVAIGKATISEAEVAAANEAVTRTAADATGTAAAVTETTADTTAAPPQQPQPIVEASLEPTQNLPSEAPPEQAATASTKDPVADEAKAEANAEVKAAVNFVDADECLVADPCIDRYLWALYERTPKEDTIKEQERRQVTVKRKGKTVTVTRSFTKLVDEDFAWKDPKAADKAGMPMPDYVIGGMDKSFKLKLFHVLRAAEEAGLSPGITSAFRDDYRQAIASGLKAASNRSYHGGSLRGGYGHGLAADVVSTMGATRDERWNSSEKLWTWIDANGKQFGIARPYLDHDPPHVAPVDGQEYASHHGGARARAASNVHKHVRLAASNKKRTQVAAR